MITVVQCVNSFDLGGLERMVLSLASQLKTRGFHSSICCIENRGGLADEAEQMGITVHALNMAQNGKLATFRSYCALLRQHKTGVIHSHNFKPFYYSALAKLTGSAAGHIHTRHGVFVRPQRAAWRYRLLRRGVNKIVTVSADGREELAQLSGLTIDQIGVVANGVDTDRFHPAPDKAALRRELGLPVEVKLIIVAARLSPEKDLLTLLRAFRLVLDRWGKRPACPSSALLPHPSDISPRTQRLSGEFNRRATEIAETDSGALGEYALPRLVVVGDGLSATELRNEANRLGIAGQVDFLGMRTDVPQLLQAADVFALSSISEGLSMALIEAAACGLPIVATAVGGNSEIVNAPAGGRLVPVRNPDAMAAALFAILDDEPGRQAMGDDGRQHAVANFSLDRMVDDYILLYQQAMGGSLEL